MRDIEAATVFLEQFVYFNRANDRDCPRCGSPAKLVEVIYPIDMANFGPAIGRRWHCEICDAGYLNFEGVES